MLSVVAGDAVLLEYDMERIMEQLETRCYDGLQEAMKTTEGIGIEYDEDVVCDICRSVHAVYLHSFDTVGWVTGTRGSCRSWKVL